MQRVLNTGFAGAVQLAGVLLVFLFAASVSRADWVSLSGAEVAPNIAEFHVEEDGVRVILEVHVGDLKQFADLVPGEWLPDSGANIGSDQERLDRFAREGLTIRAEGEAPLSVQSVTIDRRVRKDRAGPAAGKIDPISGRKFPEPPKDPRVLYAELFYQFVSGKPGRMTIFPPTLEDGTMGVSIGMIVFHNAVPVIDFRFLSSPATLTLNWEDPWFSRFSNPNLNRHHKYPRMTFLYADRHEIRHEALVRVRDAMDLVGMASDDGKLDADTAASLAAAAEKAIGARTPMSIEDAPVTPDFDRSAYMRIGLRGLEFLQPGEVVDVDADILGLIWSAPTDGLPKEAEIEWTWFDPNSPDVAGYAVDLAGPFLFQLTPDDGVVTWTNHFKTNPYPEIAAVMVERPEASPVLYYVLGGLAALGFAFAGVVFMRSSGRNRPVAYGALAIGLAALVAIPATQNWKARQLPDLDPEKLSVLTTDLLNNVYRAFDFRTEDQVYDRLALTLGGDVLEQVYLDQRETLKVALAGGAEARVDALEVTDIAQLEPADPGTLSLQTDWRIRGTVGHWGHNHSRSNGYQAELVLEPVEGNWKITGFDVISQERLQ